MYRFIRNTVSILLFLNVFNIQVFAAEIQEVSMQEYNELSKIVNANKNYAETINKVLSRIKKLREYVLGRFGTEYVKMVINLEVEANVIVYVLKAYENEFVFQPHKLIYILKAHVPKQNIYLNEAFYQDQKDDKRFEALDTVLKSIRSDYKRSDKEIFDDIKNQSSLNKYNYNKISLELMPRLLRLCYSLKLTKSNESLLNESYSLLLNLLFRVTGIAAIPKPWFDEPDTCKEFENRFNEGLKENPEIFDIKSKDSILREYENTLYAILANRPENSK